MYKDLYKLLLGDSEDGGRDNMIKPIDENCTNITTSSSAYKEEASGKELDEYSSSRSSISSSGQYVPKVVKLHLHTDKFTALSLELDDKLTQNILNSIKALLDYDSTLYRMYITY